MKLRFKREWSYSKADGSYYVHIERSILQKKSFFGDWEDVPCVDSKFMSRETALDNCNMLNKNLLTHCQQKKSRKK